MGSGLILFLIVGAWLAVLVPIFLRGHDTATSHRSADRFSYAMRVLSRRPGRDVLVPRRKYSSLIVSETKSPRPARIPEEVDAPLEVFEPGPKEPRQPATAAERRARALAVLVGLVLITAGLVLAGFRVALFANLICDALLVLFVVHLRRQAVLRARLRARRARLGLAPIARPAAHPGAAPAAPVARPAATPILVPRIAGIPDRMPSRPDPLAAPLPAPAARYDDRPLPVAATGTDTWSPVPVPTPTYVNKPMAPKRNPRVLDLTKPGEWTAGLDAEDVGLGIFDEGPELEDIIERRRAAGDW